MLFAESKKGEAKEGQPQKETQTDGFEPFVNPEPPSDPLFTNVYAGNFAQRMELNRRGIERVLKIAHLDGKIVLTQFIPSRKSSSEAQGNKLAAKRNLFFGEKIEDDRENPVRRVVPTPQGWRIEINDARITEDLGKKKLTGEKLQTEFIQQFNEQLKQGVLECVWREKVRSPELEHKLLIDFSAFSIGLLGSLSSAFLHHRYANIPLYSLLFVPITFLLRSVIWRLRGFDHDSQIVNRKIDNLFEYAMPLVEIDKVARTLVFLSLKGRTLVREVKPDANNLHSG